MMNFFSFTFICITLSLKFVHHVTSHKVLHNNINKQNYTKQHRVGDDLISDELEVKKKPYKVLRVYPVSNEELDFLVNLWKSASKYQLNFWKDPSLVGTPADIMVPPQSQARIESIFKSIGISYTTIIEDVKKLIIERESKVEKATASKSLLRDDADFSDRTAPYFEFDRYHSYEEMRIYMRALETRYPEIAKVYTLGFSRENRPIEMIKISNPVNATGKKSIWIDAGIHAREWASLSTAIYFMKELVTRYGQDAQINQYVNNLTWYITPCINPDGYEFTRSSRDPDIRLWRKNRSNNEARCKGFGCCKGVDLNRNFDFHFGESGASDNPCEEIYHGPYAFSEPESNAVHKFINWYKNDIEAVLTMHTYSQLWIHPFGHKKTDYPDDVDELLSTAQKATSALKSLYGTEYKVGSGADRLYPASGGSDDWAKSNAGIKYVYLLELRPEEQVYDGFILDSNQLIPTARETWEGIKVVTDAVLERNGFVKIRKRSAENFERPSFRFRYQNGGDRFYQSSLKQRNQYRQQKLRLRNRNDGN